MTLECWMLRTAIRTCLLPYPVSPPPCPSLLYTMPACFFPAGNAHMHTLELAQADTQQCKHAHASATRARSDLRTIGGGAEGFALYHHALAASAAHPASHQLGGDAHLREHACPERLLDCFIQELSALRQPLLPRGSQ